MSLMFNNNNNSGHSIRKLETITAIKLETFLIGSDLLLLMSFDVFTFLTFYIMKLFVVFEPRKWCLFPEQIGVQASLTHVPMYMYLYVNNKQCIPLSLPEFAITIFSLGLSVLPLFPSVSGQYNNIQLKIIVWSWLHSKAE